MQKSVFSYKNRFPEEELARAIELYDHLKELYRLREAILKMDDAMIREIKSYTYPPENVKIVMAAVFMALGEPKKKAEVCDSLNQIKQHIGEQMTVTKVLKFAPELIRRQSFKLPTTNSGVYIGIANYQLCLQENFKAY